jgi:hypothetical protein
MRASRSALVLLSAVEIRQRAAWQRKWAAQPGSCLMSPVLSGLVVYGSTYLRWEIVKYFRDVAE